MAEHVLKDKLLLVADFLQQHRCLTDAHLVDFIVDNQWESCIPETIRNDRLKLTNEEWFQLLKDEWMLKDQHLANTQTDHYHFQLASLRNYVQRAFSLTLRHLDVCTSVDDFLDSHGAPIKESLHFDQIMKSKKLHEVEEIAKVVASLAAKYNIKQIIDIGSGKGYLGSFLALRYNLQVFGIDCENSNSLSARKWNQKMKKLWKSHERRAEERKQNKQPSKRGKKWKAKTDSSEESNDSNKILFNLKDNCAISDNEDMLNMNFEKLESHLEGLYIPITQNIRNNVDLKKIMDPYVDQENNLLLVGLHTCGNLSASMMNIFLNNDNIKILCNIGCCYHLIDEKFSSNPHWKGDSNLPKESSFPLSNELLQLHFSLGRNARMLASESLDRFITNHTKSHDHLFYRSILQVLLKDKLADVPKSMQVGRFNGPCKDIFDYVQQSLKRLQLNNIAITDEEVKMCLNKHASEEKKIEAFFHIRSILAPVIEGFILLDRLCHLKEQEYVDQAFLIPLFDAVTSPRCYALIVIKK